MYINKNKNEENKTIILAKQINSETWIEFDSQADAAKYLGLYKSNVNHAIKGKIKTTGGYEFKIKDSYNEKKDTLSWEEIKLNNKILDLNKGHPSKYRIVHETVNGIIGKKCCKCKAWTPLTNFNYSKTHWDKLRNDCKQCLSVWRKKNREKINKNMVIYERNRKSNDPKFKLVKTLRSRLNSALKRKNVQKGISTLDLTGCELQFLKEYLEAKFVKGMSWENHGEWHIDHIKPCCSFNLEDEDEQKKCFHFTNLQPMWAKENLSKGGKYTLT